jgi:hypothetical protein
VREVALGHRLWSKSGEHVVARKSTALVRGALVREQSGEGVAKRRNIADRDERAAMRGADDIDHSTIGVRYNGSAAQLRFHSNEPESFLARRHGQDTRPLVERNQRGLRQGTVPPHALRQSEGGGSGA